LDDWERSLALFKDNKLKNSQFVFMGHPSTDLRGDILSKKRIGVSVGKLHKIMSDHPEVDYDLLEGLKEKVNFPEYVLQSATMENSIVVIPIILDDGRVFVVPIRKNVVTSTNETINMITSIYLKENPEWLSRERASNRVIFERVGGAA
jgi:hypothetical protein